MISPVTPATVLVVEDDPRTAALLELYLRDHGYDPTVVHDGNEALDAARRVQPALVVLDLMLPGVDGWQICRALRDEGDVPILILSARQEEQDRLAGLRLGADDYVVKPFSPREVVLRVDAILRRSRRTGAPPTAERGIRVDRTRRSAVSYGREVNLTPSEFKLLDALVGQPGRTFERRDLLESLYPGGGYVVPKVVDVHIAKLRQKLEPDPTQPVHIVTVRGFGYRYEREAGQ
ncbi:MAG: response regulator transcription factor [Planctomycetota bacterium]